MKRFAILNVSLLVLLLSLGCDPMKRPPGSESDPLPARDYQRIQVIDQLKPWLFFGREIVTPGSVEGSPMTIDLPIRNKSNKELNIQYRFEFFDKDGRPLTREQSWRFLTISPKIEYPIKGVGTNPDSTDWRMVVRPAQ